MELSDVERGLLREVLQHLDRQKAFPRIKDFDRRLGEQKAVIDELAELGYLCTQGECYQLTWKGLWAADDEAAKREVNACEGLLEVLRQTQPDPGTEIREVTKIAAAAGIIDARDAARHLAFLGEFIHVDSFDPKTGLAWLPPWTPISTWTPESGRRSRAESRARGTILSWGGFISRATVPSATSPRALAGSP